VIFRRFRGATKSASLWDKAIRDAQELIEESHASVPQLKRSIGLMRELRDKGAPFPGESLMPSQQEREGN
jgi:hypothetical protein